MTDVTYCIDEPEGAKAFLGNWLKAGDMGDLLLDPRVHVRAARAQPEQVAHGLQVRHLVLEALPVREGLAGLHLLEAEAHGLGRALRDLRALQKVAKYLEYSRSLGIVS